jgi:two-component system, NtrC family, sensor kinase
VKPRANRLVFLAAALLLTAAVAALGGASVARQVAGFQPLGFTAVPSGGAWRVEAVSRPSTGLRPGDEILALQGREVESRGALASALRGRDTSELLISRGDGLERILYSRPPLDVDFPFLILALIGAAYLLIGFYTLLKDGGRPHGDAAPSRLFFLWCLASAAFYLLTPGNQYDALGRLLYAGDLAGRLFLPPLTLHLFLVFPSWFGRSPRGGAGRRAMPFLYLPAFFLLLIQADLMSGAGLLLGGGDVGAALALTDRLEVGHLALYALVAVAVLVLRLRRRADWEEERQLRWIAVGMLGGYLPFVAFYVVPFLAGVSWPETAVSAAVLPLLLVPLTFAYAILRYKLWDIEVMVRDTISYTLTLLLGVIGFSLANLAIGRGLPADTPLLRNVLVFLAGLSIAGVLVPARRGISGGLERLQYRGSFGKRRALLDFGRELLRERDLDRLCETLLAAVTEAVDLERADLYLVRGGALRPVRGPASDAGALPPALPLDVLGDDFWREDARRLGVAALPGPSTLPTQHLYAAGYRYALPLTVHDNPVGLVLTGWKEGQERLTSDDVALLRQLLDRASLAIENAQLVDELQSRLDEVSQLQQYNEGIIESSPAAIAVLDAAGAVVTANLGLARMVGRERGELTGRRFAELLPVEPLPEPGSGPLEVAFCPPEGGERHLQISAARFERYGRGGSILVIHDVSERVVMEAALKERDRLAALGVMAAGVAHEVNTPLTGISSYAQMLLADTPADDPRHEVLRKVERQTFRAARIVHNLLDFARNRSGEMGAVALAGVVDECLELLRERLSKRGVRVAWTPPPEGVAVVHGESGELQQVVTNLLLNASDAMEEGGGTLRLEVAEVAAADGGGRDRARLVVADTGCGIPERDLERIFEPFVTTKLGRGGTGLGLAISADIVRHHGGELVADSRPGEGAVFTLTLPLEAARHPAGGDDEESGAVESPLS